MFGSQRERTGILVDPEEGHFVDTTDEVKVAEFKNEIW